MKVKTIVAVSAIAVAGAAFPAVNYETFAKKTSDPFLAIRTLNADAALQDEAAKVAAYETVDGIWAANPGDRTWRDEYLSFPKTCAVVLEKMDYLSPTVKSDILSHASCANLGRKTAVVSSSNDVNYTVQLIAAGRINPNVAKRRILEVALGAIRRDIRKKGGTFVGKEGNARVQDALNLVAAKLNAPRFAGAKEALEPLGIAVEWDFALARFPKDREIAELKRKILLGDVYFSGNYQQMLSVVMGVEGYNEFVRIYNEGSGDDQ